MQAELKNRSRPVIRKTESHLACRRSKHTLPHRLRFKPWRTVGCFQLAAICSGSRKDRFESKSTQGWVRGCRGSCRTSDESGCAIPGGRQRWRVANQKCNLATSDMEALTDQQDSLSMGAIAFDLSDTTHNTLYAGNWQIQQLPCKRAAVGPT